MNYAFGYVAPRSRAELFRLLSSADGCAILAGGTDLICDIRGGNRTPKVVVDLKQVREFSKLAFSKKEGLSIGAAVTCAELLASPLIKKRFPALILTAMHLGSNQVRQRATAVGNVCNASPCADVGLALFALQAVAHIGSPRGTRVVPVTQLITGVKRTCLAADEIVERVVVPAAMADAKAGFEKLKRIKGHDLSLVSACMVKKGRKMFIAIGSAAPTPVVLPALASNTPPKKAADLACKAVKPIDDIRCSREYRLTMLHDYVEKLAREV